MPWQFNMLDRGKGYEAAWTKLMDRDGFYADFGPSTVERNDPMFLLQEVVLLVERPVVAVCDDADAQGAGQRPAARR